MSKMFEKYKPTLVRLVILITSLSILVGAGTYVLFSKKQTYTASTNIKFTNSDASNGYAYDGSQIADCIEDITGTEVLNNAIKDVGIEDSITSNTLAKMITVEEVIPDDEQKKIDSALDNGKEYEYNPVEYKISISTSMPEAGKILNAVAKEFIIYYSENHIASDTFPSDVSTVVSDDNDYIEIADTIRTNVETMETFLDTKNESYGDYHNSENGYSFSDLKEKYEYVYDVQLAKLYALILENKATKNPELLLSNLKQSNETLSSRTDTTSSDLESVETLIKSYSEKNKANGSVQNGTTGDEYDENHTNIINDVYENESNPKSTYDELFSKYLTESDSISSNDIDTSYNEYLIKVFSDATTLSDETVKTELEDLITEITDSLKELHGYATQLRSEHAEIESVGVITQLNTPISQKTISVKMYTLLAMMACWIGLAVAIPVCWIFKKNIETFLKSKNI